MNPKVKSYIGFAVKKGGIEFGLYSLKPCKKPVYAILLREGKSGNIDEARRIACARNVPCAVADGLDEVKKGAIIAAITDQNLAKAIVSELAKDNSEKDNPETAAKTEPAVEPNGASY